MKIKKFSFDFLRREEKVGSETIEEERMISAEKLIKEHEAREKERANKSSNGQMSYGLR